MAKDDGKDIRCNTSEDPDDKSIKCWYNEPYEHDVYVRGDFLNREGYTTVDFYGADFGHLHFYRTSYLDLDGAHCYERWDRYNRGLVCSKDRIFITKQVSELESQGENVKLLF